MTVLAQPLSRPGPSFPATLNVSRLSAARPRHDPNAEPAPINPNFIASAQPAFAASEVAPDDYLRLYGRHGSRGSSAPDQPKSERQTTRWVVDMIAGKRFAWTARSAAAKLHMDEQWLRNRLRHGPVCHAGPPPVRLDWSDRHVPPAPTETECTDEIE